VKSEVALLADYLLQRGLKPVVILLDAETFGGSPGADKLAAGIQVLGVPVRKITCDCDLEQVLSNGDGRGV
jgi:hypothetical protein